MIVSLFLILLCQLIGEIVAHAAIHEIPGPVIGMALLFVLMLARDRLPFGVLHDGAMGATCRGLIAQLSLLFIPAGVGVVQRFDLLALYGVGLGVALVASTLLTLLATVAAFRIASRFFGADDMAAEPTVD